MINEKKMNWNILETEQQIAEIKNISAKQPVLIYKHSVHCDISYSVLHKLEDDWKHSEMSDVKVYFLDLHAYRKVSDEVASIFNVVHESPQILVIFRGKAIYENSHFGINYTALKDLVAKTIANKAA